MTETQRNDPGAARLCALWQWIGVSLAHAAIGAKPPYVEPLLHQSSVLIHPNNYVTVQFADGTIIEVRIQVIADIEDGFAIPTFV